MNLQCITVSIVLLIPLTASAQSPSEQLQTLFEDEWQYNLREYPTMASGLGDKRYNDRWPDVSLKAISARNEHQRAASQATSRH